MSLQSICQILVAREHLLCSSVVPLGCMFFLITIFLAFLFSSKTGFALAQESFIFVLRCRFLASS